MMQSFANEGISSTGKSDMDQGQFVEILSRMLSNDSFMQPPLNQSSSTLDSTAFCDSTVNNNLPGVLMNLFGLCQQPTDSLNSVLNNAAFASILMNGGGVTNTAPQQQSDAITNMMSSFMSAFTEASNAIPLNGDLIQHTPSNNKKEAHDARQGLYYCFLENLFFLL